MADWEPNNCPNCGGDEVSWGYSMPPLQWVIQCHHDGCEVMLVTATKAEMISGWQEGKWTHRTVDYDENGHPIYEARPTPTPQDRRT